MIVRARPNLLPPLFTLGGSIVPPSARKRAGIVAVACLAPVRVDAMVRALDRIVHHALGEPMPEALQPQGFQLD